MNEYPHNPLLDNRTFVPDVEAHAWGDGRIYLYGSYDIQGNRGYCSDVYHVFSSPDLINWTDHGVAFSLADSNWARDCGALYAPDCAYRDGWYYLYYCVPDGRCGVAKSQSPAGPFRDVGQIAGVQGIDPAVLMDDDGQAYLYWGQLTWGKVAKLRDNMVEIDPDTITQSLTVAEHEFHEGSSVKKINGKYYFLFADTHRHGGRPTSLGYAVSDDPMAGFRYGGVVIDNFGCDPAVWNDHGSMECFGGQWYVFYHRSTHGTEFSRRVCAEPICIQPDGSIPEVVQTSAGVGRTIPADRVIPAQLACELSGQARVAGEPSAGGALMLTELADRDTATYRYLDFHGEDTFRIRMRSGGEGRVELYTDGLYHAELSIPDGTDFVETVGHIPPLHGTHTLTLKFYGNLRDAAVEAFSFAAGAVAKLS